MSFTEFALPTSKSGPLSITTGPDGALWFTEIDNNKIGRIATDGALTEFSLPSAGSGPFGITTGPDGALWFTETNKIGRITTSGSITEYSGVFDAGGIVTGSDGALWFTEGQPNKIGRITT